MLENLTYLTKDEPMDSLDGYWEDSEADGKELTVRNVVDKIKIDQLEDDKDYGSYMTGADWKNILNAIKQDETLMNMKIIAVAGDPSLAEGEKRAEDAPKEGALSAVFVNEETEEAVVAFRGTAEYEWKDNFLGGAATDAADGVSTEYQMKALNWYQGLDLADAGYTTITVTGHSKGGNKAKYIALLDETVTRCVSYDGQGFSDEFYQQYEKEIALRQYTITNYNVEYDYVNLLLNDVGEIIYCKGYDYGAGRFLEAHCPNTFFWFDEEGHAGITPVDGQAAELVELNEFLNSYLRTLTAEEKIETMEVIGGIAEQFFNNEPEGDSEAAEEKDDDHVKLNLILYAAGYAAVHPHLTQAIKKIMHKFYSDEEIIWLIDYVLLIIALHHPVLTGIRIGAFFYEIIAPPAERAEDLQVASSYNPLEKNRVFSTERIKALGSQGKTLMNTGSVACMSWDDGIESLKELVDCLPENARSSVLRESLNGITGKFYKEEYETMGEYLYNTTETIAEELPKLDEQASKEIDEITRNLSSRIAAIKNLESHLNVNPLQSRRGTGLLQSACIR